MTRVTLDRTLLKESVRREDVLPSVGAVRRPVTFRGSAFSVRRPGSGGPPEEGPEDGPAPAPSTPRSLRILLVEDNDDVARAMVMLLQHMGHTVEWAADGESALELARSFTPQVVFVDIGLPGMDGYEVARRLQHMEQSRKSVLIALTGYGMEEDRKKTAEAGFYRHLTKPTDLPTLRSVLNNVPL